MNQLKCFDEMNAEKVNRGNRKRLEGKEENQVGPGKRKLNVLATLKMKLRPLMETKCVCANGTDLAMWTDKA